MGRPRGGVARDDMHIVSGCQRFLVGTKKFTAHSLEAIADYRVSNLFCNGDTEPRVGKCTRPVNHNEMPSDEALSYLPQVFEFGAFADATRFRKSLPQRSRLLFRLSSFERRIRICKMIDSFGTSLQINT